MSGGQTRGEETRQEAKGQDEASALEDREEGMIVRNV